MSELPDTTQPDDQIEHAASPEPTEADTTPIDTVDTETELIADDPVADALRETNRAYGLLTFGVMALLLLCIVLVLIASRRIPAGL